MYPGTAHHQDLLARIVDYYRDDERIVAVCLFGSLTRGNWDQYSDLDLDVVVNDDVQIAVMDELRNLCKAFQPLGEAVLILVPNGDDSGDVVLKSLTELSVRYHTLATTSPNIVDSLELLTGKIELDTIKAAGIANRKQPPSVSSHDVDRILRWAIEVDICIQRERFWQAVRLLQFMRETLIEIFAITRDYPRSYHAFDALADERLNADIGHTLPSDDLMSLREALSTMLNILDNDLTLLSNGQLSLTNTQREIISKIRAKLVA